MQRIGVVDTMFARYDMGAEVLDELASCPGHGRRFEVVRRTVPGFKDLAVAAKRLIENDSCRIVVALGMPGKAEIDKVCAHEASKGIMQAQLMTSTPILEVFVHEDEEDHPPASPRSAATGPGPTPATPTGCSTSPSSSFPGPARASARATATPAPWSQPGTDHRPPQDGSLGQAEDLLGHDVALDLGGPPPMVRAGEKRKPPAHVVNGQPVDRRRRRHMHRGPGAGQGARRSARGPARGPSRRWPWASARALRTEASGPGARPASTADTVRRRRTSQDLALDPGSHESLSQPCRRRAPPPAPARPGRPPSGRCPTAHPRPTATPARWPASPWPAPSPSPPRPPGGRPGRRTSSKNTSLKAWAPVMSTRGRISRPSASMGQTKYEMPVVLGRLGVGPGQQDAEAGQVGEAGPHLLAAHHPARRRRPPAGVRERGQVRCRPPAR